MAHYTHMAGDRGSEREKSLPQVTQLERGWERSPGLWLPARCSKQADDLHGSGWFCGCRAPQARRNPQGHLVLVLGRADWQSSPTHLLGPGGPHLAL